MDDQYVVVTKTKVYGVFTEYGDAHDWASNTLKCKFDVRPLSEPED
jgi:hypothetical protein